MTSEGSGLGAPGFSTVRRPAGMWCAASAWHICGSQDTTAELLTCAPVQATASLTATAAACGALASPPRGGRAREGAPPRRDDGGHHDCASHRDQPPTPGRGRRFFALTASVGESKEAP